MFSNLRSSLPLSLDWASLLLRIAFGGLMAGLHGWGKFQSYSEKAADWADPIGVGAPTSLALAIFGELVCGILIMLGLLTRLATIPAIITMLVAVFFVHWNDPLADKEHALLYFFAYAAIFFLGSGRYSLDAVLAKRKD
ncbi:MAG: DoxX family protein [Saprospiraceae bacterium]|nr:DoxX family protein [Saprospiraceae bacterium]